MSSNKSSHEMLLNTGACWGRVLREDFQGNSLKNEEKPAQKGEQGKAGEVRYSNRKRS